MRHRAVDDLERRDADGAAGSVDQLDLSGKSSSRPNLRIECVCPPHTSISVQGRVDGAADLRHDAGDRRRIAVLVNVAHGCPPRRQLERAHLGQDRVRLARRLLVDPREGKPDVHEHVIADLGLGHVREADGPDDAREVDAGGAQLVGAGDLDDPTRNG